MKYSIYFYVIKCLDERKRERDDHKQLHMGLEVLTGVSDNEDEAELDGDRG